MFSPRTYFYKTLSTILMNHIQQKQLWIGIFACAKLIVGMCMCSKLLQLSPTFGDPMVCQAPLSIRFLRQEYWNGLPCSPPGDLPNPGIEPASLMSPALAGGFFATSATWEILYFTYGNILVSMLFSQVIPPSPSLTVSESLFFMSVLPLLPCK